MKKIYEKYYLLKEYIYDVIKNYNLLNKKITIVVVSKNQTVDVIQNLIQSGIKEFGENYIQEGIQKIKLLKKYHDVIWHFIGKIQSNKIKKIAKYFHWCQTIHDEKQIFLLNQYRKKHSRVMNVLIQINISHETNKNGVHKDHCMHLAEIINCTSHLRFRGVMAMPKIQKNNMKINIQYETIKNIFQELQKKYNSVDTLSLGTTLDIKKSILYESNMIRIGRFIFQK